MKCINKPNQFLTGAMYAPFCRTLSVPMSEWDKDIKNMADLGYNCIHGFAEWHDVEYEKGKFDFTKIDHMIECAHKYNITVIVNIATQNGVGFYSPRWLMEECRNVAEGFVDSQGNVLPDSQYVVTCIDNPIYHAYAQRYLKNVALHFGNDIRVSGYVLWGEPLLFRPGYSGSDICYCKHTIAKFRNWLQKKYNSIEKLNDIWSSEGPADFVDFCQVMPPTGNTRQRGGHASWEDWKEFMEENLAGYITEANSIFKENGALQPTITEMTTGVNQSIDIWKLANCTDIIGISCFNRPSRTTSLYMSMATSMAKLLDKSTFVVEAGGGSVKYMSPVSPSAEELKSTLLQRAGHGVKGLMYWCWRPRMSDTEGNDFGLVKPNGVPLEKTIKLGKLANRMNEMYHVYDSCERKSDVAIFTSRQINHLMGADGLSDNYCNSLIGAYYMLSDIHINSDFINENEILNGSLKNYRTLIMPCSYIVSEECADKIKAFTERGGQLIADYILCEKKPGGFCYYQLPGAGFDKVFGIERDDIRVIEDNSLYKQNDLGVLRGGVIEKISAITASTIEKYENDPIITLNHYGKGMAYYFASQFFRSYITSPSIQLRKRLESILAENKVLPYAALVEADKEAQSPLITVSMNSKKDNSLTVLTLTNTGSEPKTDILILKDADYHLVENLESVSIKHSNQNCSIDFSLNPWESLAIYKEI